jgi:prepilin peptidase CpaA
MLIRGADYAWATLALTGVGALFDWRVGRIPNVLTLGIIPVAAGAHAWTAAPGRAWEAAGFSLLGALVCALGPALLWRAGWVGGGDVKLLAAMGAVGGVTLGVEAAFFAFFCAMGFVVVRLSWRGTFFRTLGSSLTLAASPLVSRNAKPASKGLASKGLTSKGLSTGSAALTGETLDTMRFGPFAFAGAALTLLFHGGIL